MDSKKLAEVKAAVDELAAKIGASEGLLPTYGYSKDFAYPHIEADGAGLMHFVVVERGKEIDRKSTTELNQLLYWIFEGVTFSLASTFELNHRIETQDTRRLIFAKQEELLADLDPRWGEMCKRKHQEILSRYPFDDLAGLRASYWRELRSEGYDEEQIKRMAHEKFPDE